MHLVKGSKSSWILRVIKKKIAANITFTLNFLGVSIIFVRCFKREHCYLRKVFKNKIFLEEMYYA